MRCITSHFTAFRAPGVANLQTLFAELNVAAVAFNGSKVVGFGAVHDAQSVAEQPDLALAAGNSLRTKANLALLDEPVFAAHDGIARALCTGFVNACAQQSRKLTIARRAAKPILGNHVPYWAENDLVFQAF